MGVESIEVTTPHPDVQEMLDDAVAELKADIISVKNDVKKMQTDITVIKQNTDKEIGNG